MSEMYILYDEFSEGIMAVEDIDENQVKGIIEMTILYFNKEKYSEKVKNLLKAFFN
ncbi:hypothetical protein [Alkaliphilus sp. B6464]|uniref:hypothetical protein n=1 Tax=Alkaliphilus sp. B6464 TaxID=2731219 RepID=UPI001BA594A1|nr:hypothetical protein [Alkaliphilus sp. B6464]QUH21221.1 hypothetical protein HYG84_15910 [Alkaliphilus sp. B6464]